MLEVLVRALLLPPPTGDAPFWPRVHVHVCVALLRRLSPQLHHLDFAATMMYLQKLPEHMRLSRLDMSAMLAEAQASLNRDVNEALLVRATTVLLLVMALAALASVVQQRNGRSGCPPDPHTV